MKQATVYLIQEPNTEKDLSSAAAHGRIVPIFSAYDKPSLNINASLQKMYEVLSDYDQEQDAICFAGGDPLLEFLAGIVIERLQFDKVNHLVWNRERGSNGERTGRGFYLPKMILLNAGAKNG